VHFAYGFDLLCQTLDQGMTSSVLHFSFLDQVHGPIFSIYCLYDPSSTNVIFDGVSIHGPLGSFLLLLIEDSYLVHICNALCILGLTDFRM
jgi:hypothetical protein